MSSPQLHLHTSNRLDLLAGFLAEELSIPLSSPLCEEVIVVQSRGMARWVSLELAERQGVVMNARFVFPRLFMDEAIQALKPEFSAEADSREVLAWRMAALLPSLLGRPEFTGLRHYLDDRDSLKEFQLAGKLADVFDQYLVYRPEWIRKWELGGGTDDWQVILWQELSRNFPGERHLAGLVNSIDFAKASAFGPLPERVTIFGISSLPPLFIEMFRKLSFRIPVHLFLLQPTDDYRGDQMSERSRTRLLARESKKKGRPVTLEELNLTRGNPLLESMGGQGSQFLDLVIDAGFHPKGERFHDSGEKTLLQTIQSRMRHNLPDDVTGERKAFPASDRSLQLHSCHSPMREVEVLYDRLLNILECDPNLKARDILVMTPEIETYAPLIRAVFGCPESPALRIPYSIADRNPRNENHVVDVFLQLLELPERRFTSGEIISLLESPVFRTRFDFQEEDLPRIRKWIAESGIRWGIDAAHRKALGVPALVECTWRHGLDRLLLGYALQPEEGRLLDGMLPCDGLEGEDAQAMGRFVMAVEELILLVDDLKSSRPVTMWMEALERTMDRFVPEEEEFQVEARPLRRALSSLRKSSHLAQHTASVELRVIRHHLEEILQLDVQGGGFLTGGVTFCSLKPMRSIPSRVVCLLGMNDGDFPRRPVHAGFDRIAVEPRCGDRSMREDDRYLFLETILSAGDTLLISHVGQSMRDQTVRPPSVMVSELFDHADGVASIAGKKPSEQLVVCHPLHPFSARGFSGGEHFSYSGVNAAAALQVRRSCLGQPIPEMRTTMPEEPLGEGDVELGRLLNFFSKPAATFLRERFRIRLARGEEMIRDEEDFVLDHLEEYHLKTGWVQRLLQGKSLPDWEEVRAQGNLPLGRMGEAGYHDMCQEAGHFYGRLSPFLDGASPQSVEVNLPVGGGRLLGQIEGVYPKGLVQYHVSHWKARHAVRAWLNHLALHAATGLARETLFMTKAGTLTFAIPPDSSKILNQLVRIYRVGMARPLPIFPESSCEYAHYTLRRTARMTKGGLEAARQIWEGSDFFGNGEKEEPAHRLLFGHGDPLHAEFEKLAVEVFGDMLVFERKKKGGEES